MKSRKEKTLFFNRKRIPDIVLFLDNVLHLSSVGSDLTKETHFQFVNMNLAELRGVFSDFEHNEKQSECAKHFEFTYLVLVFSCVIFWDGNLTVFYPLMQSGRSR